MVCNLLKDLFASSLGMRMGREKWLRPIILHLTVTNRCNLKCVMCNIWKSRPKEEVGSAALARIKNSPLSKHLRILDITGGEPFLADLNLVIEQLGGKNIRIVLITTNGLLTDKIVETAREMLKRYSSTLVINVSIDGIGEIHDRIRGGEGTFRRAEQTLQELLALASEFPRLRPTVKFTILPDNHRQLLSVYRWTRGLGATFTVKPGAEFGFLDNVGDTYDFSPEQTREILEQLDEMVRSEEKSSAGLDFWGRIYKTANVIFHRELMRYLRETFIEKKLCVIGRCYSSSISILLHNDGKIYNCPTLMKPIGDLYKQSLEEIWWGKEMSDNRRFIASGRCACYSQCDQMPALAIDHKLELFKGLLFG